jgi:asparagine synthase (glutamine-hydrolysing)
MLTGFGGDELCGLRPSEVRAMGRTPPVPQEETAFDNAPDFLTEAARETLLTPLDLPPRAASSSSTVEVAALSAARYMREGIWPVHPMATPELVHFCARLPPEWRYRRQIERSLLDRLGVSDRVTYPAARDTFLPMLGNGMRIHARPVLERLFEAPILADQGIVDGARLRSAYSAWCDGGEHEGSEFFYAAAILELCLRRMG